MKTPTPTSTAGDRRAIADTPRKPATILAVTSGKGGVGKTFVAANLGAALVQAGRKVLLLDADLGLANLDIVLGLQPKVNLHDVLTGQVSIDSAILQAPGGLAVMPAASGLVEYSRLTGEVQDDLRSIIAELGRRYDYLLLDTGAGISDIVLFTASLAQDVLVVATPEPTSIADAYATIKVLAMLQKRSGFKLVFNQVRNRTEGVALAQQLQDVVERFLQPQQGSAITLKHLGDIPFDVSVRDAVRARQLLLQGFPGAPAALAVTEIAKAMERD